MEIKEIKKESKEKIYELTEDELQKIIKVSYSISKEHLNSYIGFCCTNYIYKLNLSGICDFLSELLKFISGKSDRISNKEDNLSYWDYRAENFYCPWSLNNLDKLIKGEL